MNVSRVINALVPKLLTPQDRGSRRGCMLRDRPAGSAPSWLQQLVQGKLGRFEVALHGGLGGPAVSSPDRVEDGAVRAHRVLHVAAPVVQVQGREELGTQ